PDAGWDSTVTPVRRGLYYTKIPDLQPTCLNELYTFFFDETLPVCWYEKAWINFDSACGPNNWILLDTVNVKKPITHGYTSTCDTTGKVTVGLIIKNGLDKNGHPCYDTAWYNFFVFIPKLP